MEPEELFKPFNLQSPGTPGSKRGNQGRQSGRAPTSQHTASSMELHFSIHLLWRKFLGLTPAVLSTARGQQGRDVKHCYPQAQGSVNQPITGPAAILGGTVRHTYLRRTARGLQHVQYGSPSPHPHGICSKAFSGCLKLQIVPKPRYAVFFPYI